MKPMGADCAVLSAVENPRMSEEQFSLYRAKNPAETG